MNSKTACYIIMSFLGGAIVPLQLAIVHAFKKSTEASQIQATFYLYLGGTVVSLILAFLLNGSIKPPMANQANWWMWLTGFIGSFYILLMFIAAPKIGAANTLLWVFLGQMYIATLLSLTGWFGLAIRELDKFKVLGLLLITLGGLTLLYAENRTKS